MAYTADGTPRSESSLPIRVLGGSFPNSSLGSSSAGGSPATLEATADPVVRGRYTAAFHAADPGGISFAV